MPAVPSCPSVVATERPPPRPRPLRFFARRQLWWPTWLGWGMLAAVALGAGTAWWFGGEGFLALTDRPAPDILVVEGWIGNGGVNAAASEFRSAGFHYVVATGGLTSDRWDTRQWSYAEMARRDLIAAGVPPERVVLALPVETSRQRTYQTALACRSALAARGLHPHSLTVFTFGAHARRSRLVFEKVFPSDVTVGAISWRPAADFAGPWWHSSDRAEDLLKETVGWLYEALLDSGRS